MKIENQVERVSAHHPLQKVLILMLLSIAVVAVLVFAIDQLNLRAWVESSGWFKIKEVTVNSSWPVTNKQVESWLPKLKERSLLALDVKSLVLDLEKKPWIQTVLLRKKYPDQLVVNVTSKTPKAIVLKGQNPYYVDEKGIFIDRVTPTVAKKLDLPIVTIQRQSTLAKWELTDGMALLDKLRSRLEERYPMSELVLETYPYFRVYLSRPRVEVAFSEKNWESQLPRLQMLLDRPPSQVGQMVKINLVFPKKAIVSSSLSN